MKRTYPIRLVVVFLIAAIIASLLMSCDDDETYTVEMVVECDLCTFWYSTNNKTTTVKNHTGKWTYKFHSTSGNQHVLFAEYDTASKGPSTASVSIKVNGMEPKHDSKSGYFYKTFVVVTLP